MAKCLIIHTIFHPCYPYIVSELDIPPECDDSDRVSITEFWKSVEVMHLAKGVNGEYHKDIIPYL